MFNEVHNSQHAAKLPAFANQNQIQPHSLTPQGTQPFYSCDSWEEQAIKIGVQDGVLNPDGSLVDCLANLKITDIEDISITAYAAMTLDTKVTSKHADNSFTIAEALVNLRQYAQDLKTPNQLGSEFRFVGKNPISSLHPTFIKAQLEKAVKVKPEIMKLYREEFIQNVLEGSGDVDGRIYSNMVWGSVQLFCRKYWAYIGSKIQGLKHLPYHERAAVVQKDFCDKYWNAGERQEDGSKKGYILTGIDEFDLVIANECQNELFQESDLHVAVELNSIHIVNGKVDPKRLKARAIASSGNILIPICQKGLHLLDMKESRQANAPALLTFLSDLSTVKTFRQKDLMEKIVAGFFADKKVSNSFVDESLKFLTKRVEKKFNNNIYALLTIALLFEKHVSKNWPSIPHPLHEDKNFAFWTFWGKIVSYIDPKYQVPGLTIPHIRTIWNVSPDFLQTPYAFSTLFQLCCRPPQTSLADAPEGKLVTFGERPAVRLSNKATGHGAVIAFEPETWLTTLLDSKSEKLPANVWAAFLQESLLLLPKSTLEGKSVVEYHPELFDGLSDDRIFELCGQMYARGEPYLDFGATVILMSAYLCGRTSLLGMLLLNGIPALLAGTEGTQEAGLLLIEKLTGSKDLPKETDYHKLIFKYFKLLASTGNKDFCSIVIRDLLAYPEMVSLPEFLEDTKSILVHTARTNTAETFALLVQMQEYFQAGDPNKSLLLKSAWKLLSAFSPHRAKKRSAAIEAEWQKFLPYVPQFLTHLCQVRHKQAVVPNDTSEIANIVKLQRLVAPTQAHTLIHVLERFLSIKPLEESLKTELLAWREEIDKSCLDSMLSVNLGRIKERLTDKTVEDNPFSDMPELEKIEFPEISAKDMLASCSGSKARLPIAETMELLAVDSPERNQLAEVLLRQSYSKRHHYFSEEIKPHLQTLVGLLLAAKSAAINLILEACTHISLQNLTNGQIGHLIGLADSLLTSRKRADIGKGVRVLYHLIKDHPNIIEFPAVQAVVQKILANGLDKRHIEKWLVGLRLPVNGKTASIWHNCKVLLRPAKQAESVVKALYVLACQLLSKNQKLESKVLVRLLAQQNLDNDSRTQLFAKVAQCYTPQEQFSIRMEFIETGMGNKSIDLVDQARQIIALRESSAAIHCNEQQQQILFTLLLSLLSLSPSTVSTVQCALALSKHINFSQAKYGRKELVVQHLKECRELYQNPEIHAELAKFELLGKPSRAFQCELLRDLIDISLEKQATTEAGMFALSFLKTSQEASYPVIINQIVWELVHTPNADNYALVQSLLNRMGKFPESIGHTLETFSDVFATGKFQPKQKGVLLSAYIKLVSKADSKFLQTLSSALPAENVQGLESIWDRVDRQLCLEHPQLMDRILSHLAPARTEWDQKGARLVMTAAARNWQDTGLKSVLLRDDVQAHLLQADVLADCIATKDSCWEPFYIKRLGLQQPISEKDQELWLKLAQDYCNSGGDSQMAWLIASRVYPLAVNKEAWQPTLQHIHKHGNAETVQALGVRSVEWKLQLEAPSLEGITANQLVTVKEIKDLLISNQQIVNALQWQQLFNRAQELPTDAPLIGDLLDYWDSQRKIDISMDFLLNTEVAFAAVYNAFLHQVDKQQTKYCENHKLLAILLSSEKIDKEKRLRLLALALPVAFKGVNIETLKFLGKKLLALDPKSTGKLFKCAKKILTKSLEKASLPLIDAVVSWLDFENKKPFAKRVGNFILSLNLARLPIQEGYDGTELARLMCFMAEENAVQLHVPDLLAWLFRQEVKQPVVKAKAMINLAAIGMHETTRTKMKPLVPLVRNAVLEYSKNMETSELVLPRLESGQLKSFLDVGEVELWINCITRKCQKLTLQGVSKQARLDVLKLLEKAVIKYPKEVTRFAEMMSDIFYAVVVDNRDIPIVRTLFGEMTQRVMKECREAKVCYEVTSCRMALTSLLKLLSKVNTESLRVHARKDYAFYKLLVEHSVALARTVLIFEDVMVGGFRDQVAGYKDMIERILFMPFDGPHIDDLEIMYANLGGLYEDLVKTKFLFKYDQARLHAIHLFTSRGGCAAAIPKAFFQDALKHLKNLFTVTYAQEWGSDMWTAYEEKIMSERNEGRNVR